MNTEGVRQRKQGTETDDKSPKSQQKTKTKPKKSKLKRCCCVCVLVPAILIGIFVFGLRSPINPERYRLPDPPALTGALEPNDILTQVTKLVENMVIGPESIAVHKGLMYSGTADGRIVAAKIGRKEEVSTIAMLGELPCGTFEDEPNCGRPLGLRFDKNGFLIVADAYLGLFKVDVDTGDYEVLFSSETALHGFKSTFISDFDIHSDGTIYFVETSYKWQRRDFVEMLMENKPYGRLCKIDPETGEATVLAASLHSPMGLQISKHEDFIAIAEAGRARIIQYHLKGNYAGRVKTYVNNLPGFPVGIRRSPSGGFWISLNMIRHADQFSLYDYLGTRPWLRYLATKILSPKFIHKVWGSNYSMLVEMNKDGKLVQSLHDPTGSTLPDIGRVHIDNGIIFIGSYEEPYVAAIDPGVITLPRNQNKKKVKKTK